MCKQKKITLCITETVKEEAIKNFPKIVNRYFDNVGIKARPVRLNLTLQFRKRLQELIDSIQNKAVNADYKKIEGMYARFAKTQR